MGILEHNVLEVRSTDGRHAVVVVAQEGPTAPDAKPKLVFE